MIDTPDNAPKSKLEAIKSLIGDLARPVSIIVTSLSASWATVVIAYKVDGFESAALFIAAVYAGLGALYWGKAWEMAKAGSASVEIEKARGGL